jgi:hypothetical protein
MNKSPHLAAVALLASLTAFPARAADPALTIYNQGFAVLRETVPLELKAGVNDLRHSGVTAQVEADSVILRDPAGKVALQILEQNYRNDPVSQELLLSLFEGKTIDFVAHEPQKPDRVGSPCSRSSRWRASCSSRCPASRAFPRSAPTPSSSPRFPGN